MIGVFTFKLRLQAAFLRLQLTHLSFKHCRLFKRKRKTLSEHLRYRQVFESILRNVDQTHEPSLANATSNFESSLRRK
jgi:hypothetical protein